MFLKFARYPNEWELKKTISIQINNVKAEDYK